MPNRDLMDVPNNAKGGTTEEAFGLTDATPCILYKNSNWATGASSNRQKAQASIESMGLQLHLGVGPKIDENSSDNQLTLLTLTKKRKGPLGPLDTTLQTSQVNPSKKHIGPVDE